VTPQQLQAIRDDWASVDPTSKTMRLMREDVYAVLNGYDALAATLSTMREEYLHLSRVIRSARDLLSGEFYAEALGELDDACSPSRDSNLSIDSPPSDGVKHDHE